MPYTPERRARMSESARALWQIPAYRAAQDARFGRPCTCPCSCRCDMPTNRVAPCGFCASSLHVEPEDAEAEEA
jgi:hypothetical protein